MEAPLPLLRRGLVALAALPALGLAACTPGATVQNNSAAPQIVDGNFDEANFVVPDDEGTGEENVALPTGNAATPAGNTATPRR